MPSVYFIYKLGAITLLPLLCIHLVQQLEYFVLHFKAVYQQNTKTIHNDM